MLNSGILLDFLYLKGELIHCSNSVFCGSLLVHKWLSLVCDKRTKLRVDTYSFDIATTLLLYFIKVMTHNKLDIEKSFITLQMFEKHLSMRGGGGIGD